MVVGVLVGAQETKVRPALVIASATIPRPTISLDSVLGTFVMENVLTERMHVQRQETRFRDVRRSP